MATSETFVANILFVLMLYQKHFDFPRHQIIWRTVLTILTDQTETNKWLSKICWRTAKKLQNFIQNKTRVSHMLFCPSIINWNRGLQEPLTVTIDLKKLFVREKLVAWVTCNSYTYTYEDGIVLPFNTLHQLQVESIQAAVEKFLNSTLPPTHTCRYVIVAM